MPDQIMLDALKKIKKTHENLVVSIGIFIGVVLVAYFFSFAMLIDSGSWFLKFEMVSSVLMVAALFFLKRIAFFFTRLLLGRYKDLLDKLVVSDLDKDEEVLLEQLKQTMS